MAVRQFVAANDDDLVCAIGALDSMQYGVVLALIRPASVSDGNESTFFSPHESGGDGNFQLGTVDTDLLWWSPGPADFETGGSFLTTDWWLVAIRKGSGTTSNRYSAYNYATGLWTDGSWGGSLSDFVAVGAGGDVRFSFQTFDNHFDGLIGGRAVWSNRLGPSDAWTADTDGDAAIKAVGLETAYQNWIDASPDAAWRFNQDSTTTAVVDDTGNGADQISISGTTVVTGDDPPGFDFSLGGVPEVTATIPLTLDVAPTATATHQAQASVPLTLDVAAQTTATHQATASIPLTLDMAAAVEAQHQVAAAVALTVGIAPQAATQHSATAAIPLTLALTPVADDGEAPTPIVLPPYREPPVPDYQEAAVPAYRERAVPAYQESAS